MTEPQTATPEELFKGLIEIQLELQKRLVNMEQTYHETYKNFNTNFKVAGIIEYEYDSGSISKVISHSDDIIKIIEAILYEKNISEAYLKRLQSITKKDRKSDLAKAEHEWLEIVGDYEYVKLFKQASHSDEWIDKCAEIGRALIDFVGMENPLIETQSLAGIQKPAKAPIIKNIELKNGNQIFIDNTDLGVKLTPSLTFLLKKLLKKDVYGEYEIIETTELKAGAGSQDAFRTKLRRLREATSKIFTLQPCRTVTNKRGYKIIFLKK